MKKIVVSDYDQTFYINDDDIEINKKNIQNFREAGNLFIIATGRSYMDFKKKANAYNLEYDYLIINHGATILDGDDNIIFNVSIDNSIIDNIKEDMNLEKTMSHFCCSLFDSRVEFEYKDLTKIEARYYNKEDAWERNEYINNKYGEYVNSYFLTSNSIEIISNKTSKSHAITVLLEKLHIAKENVYTIGDGYSDMEMIRDFNGYCMEDSVPELKEITSNVVNSVSELVKIVME
ncbi:MAG: HAD-IIB family hydrolase [Clostridia bacterium]|nr:HAD-IIB family hydrolase [Clostridia bacterium]